MVVQHLAVNGAPRRGAEEFARDWPLSIEAMLGSPCILISSVDAIVDKLGEKREHHGFSYWVVTEHSMDALAPVVSGYPARDYLPLR